MTNDYDYALWAQQMDKQIAKGLIASDGSTIDWYGKPLASLTDDELRAIFETVRDIPETGFAFIAQVCKDALNAVMLELRERGIIVHPFIKSV
jgi:hypothetical protein